MLMIFDTVYKVYVYLNYKHALTITDFSKLLFLNHACKTVVHTWLLFIGLGIWLFEKLDVLKSNR